MIAMTRRSERKLGFLYLLLIGVAVVASLLYGNFQSANIGNFPQYMLTGAYVWPLWLIILIPVLITLLYIWIIVIAKRNGLLKMNFNHFGFIFILAIIFIYMSVIIATKDITHAYGNYEVETSLLHPNVEERVWAILSFYLVILTIYAYFKLLRPIKAFKPFINLVLTLIVLFALSAIIYSLIYELDKYTMFQGIEDIFDKQNAVKSFFTITNVFGHTCYFAVMALIAIGFLNHKYPLILLSLLIAPFIFYSGSRASMLSTLILYLGVILYIYFKSYKKSKVCFYILTILIVSVVLIVLIDLYLYDFIIIEFNDGRYFSFKELTEAVFDSLFNKRFNLIEETLPNMKLDDFLFGFGYGIVYMVPRTYDGFRYYFHNAYFEYLAQGGVIWVVFVLALYLLVLYKCFRVAKDKKKWRYIALMLIFSLAEIFHGFFESTTLFTNDYLCAFITMFIITMPNLYAEYELHGYQDFYIIDVKNEKVSKTLKVEDVFKENGLVKAIKSSANRTKIQTILVKTFANMPQLYDYSLVIIEVKNDSNIENISKIEVNDNDKKVVATIEI